MIGIGTPTSQSKIPRPINHPHACQVTMQEATAAGLARMYAVVCQRE